MTRRFGWVLACGTGALALSFEVLWFRAYSLALMARPQAFGVLLGGYLGGIGVGSIVARCFFARYRERSAAAQVLPWLLLVAAASAGLVIPVFARLVSVSRHWELATVLAAAGAFPLGVVFPILAQLVVDPAGRPGADIARLYALNLLGSVSGTLLTGFVLIDRFGLASLSTAMTLGLLAAAAWTFCANRRRGRALAAGLAAVAAAAAAFVVASPLLYAHVFERLFFRLEYAPGRVFQQVVETRAGVIGVTADDAVYGSGVYDGMFNVQLRRAGENFIQRAYALAAFHPAPAQVMMIGLSSGSWAAVVANQRSVSDLTIVEINAGYLRLIPFHPPSRGLLSDSRVHIEIDDGRHWLNRHRDARFDAIVANTTYNWRANASSLLSVEFLQLVRRHLKPGGVFYYNVTSEPRAERTGATVFPYAWRLYNMMAVSDAPIVPDLERMAGEMARRHVYDVTTFDPDSPGDRALLRTVVEDVAHDLEPRDHILSRTAGVDLITDDNMGTEWRLPPRYSF